MNLFKKLKSPFAKKYTYYTLLTGSHLKYTGDIIKSVLHQNSNLKFLVLNKNHEEDNHNQNSFIQENENVQIFNCDFNKAEDVEEFSMFLQSNPDIKIKNVVHSDHYISTLDHSKSHVYSELKLMTQTNIEIPMMINSKLLSIKKLEIDSKIIHLILPSTKNLESIPEFNPKRMIGQSLKHMVKCFREDLIKNPVFFSTITIDTFDEVYLKRFENNETIPKEDLIKYRENYEKSLQLINFLLNDKLSGLDFGRKFWNLGDLEKFRNKKI